MGLMHMESKPDLLLIDGSSFLYRAYYASRRSFTTKAGIPTGATLLMSNMLGSLRRNFAKVPAAVVFDARGKSFRSTLYPEYKANRKAMPEDLVTQVEYVHRLVKALGYPLIVVPGVEADDVLGSYAREAQSRQISTLICTGDKDLAQLVGEGVRLYDGMKEVFYDHDAVVNKYGVGPEHIIDLLALMGDSSDNIPGMKGVGDKTAVALINSLGGIEQIYERRAEIAKLEFRGAKTFQAKLEQEMANVRLSYQLATIKTDVPLPVPLEELKVPEPDNEALLSLYSKLEFRRAYAELARQMGLDDTAPDATSAAAAGAAAGQEAAQSGKKTAPVGSESEDDLDTWQSIGSVFECVTDKKRLKALAAQIKKGRFVAFDTETTSLRPADSTLVGISLSLRQHEGFYIPLNHSYLGVPQQLGFKDIKEILLPVLNDPMVVVIGHNPKFDLQVMHFNGLPLKRVSGDTMLMAHLLDSQQSVSMDELAKHELHYRTITYAEVTGGKRKIPFAAVDVQDATRYSGEDAEVTVRLYETLLPRLKQKTTLYNLYLQQELPLLHVLTQMEQTGVLVDAGVLREQNVKLMGELGQLEAQIYAAAGMTFNIQSPMQLSHVLYEVLQVPPPGKKTVRGYSTSEEELQKIAPKYDIANLILRYRELAKLITTYTNRLPQDISPRTKRVHSSFNQAGTVTGRLSSSEPNLQNIPARTEEGKLIRKAFIAPEGYVILSADYSQIELRLIAHLSGDERLIAAFKAGHDIHAATAAEVLGKSIEEVTPQERSKAKATNFGLMYGMGAVGLRRQTNMDLNEARDYIERYFSRYPKIRAFMDEIKDFAHQNGMVTTLMGHEVSINAALNRFGHTDRAAINAPMQGSAADIIKQAMVEIDAWIRTLPKDTVRMTMQVHDELIFEVKQSALAEAQERIAAIMESVVQLKVPLTVSTGSAANWADAH